MRFSIRNNAAVLLIALGVINLYAQQLPSRNFTVKDGLPNNQIETTYKDSRGILWIGTHNGLSKFEDGEFSNFYVEDGLPHNSVWSIVEDKDSNLWFGTYGGGIAHFDGKRFESLTAKEGLSNDFVRKLFVKDSLLFVGTNQGVNIVNTESFLVNPIPFVGERVQVMGFFEYKGAIYCALYDQGIYRIDIEALKLVEVLKADTSISRLFSVHMDGHSLLYGVFGSNPERSKGAIHRYDFENVLAGEKDYSPYGSSIIWDYAWDGRGNLYGAAWGVHIEDGGVYKISDGEFIDMTYRLGIESSEVKSVFYDDGIDFLYVGTVDAGLYQVQLDSPIVYHKSEGSEIRDIEVETELLVLLRDDAIEIYRNDKLASQISKSEFFKYYQNNSNKYWFGYKPDSKSPDDMQFYKVRLFNDFIWVSSNFGLFKISRTGKILGYYFIRANLFEFDHAGRLIDPVPYEHLLVYDDISQVPKFTEADRERVYMEFIEPDTNYPVNVVSMVKAKDTIYLATKANGIFRFLNRKSSPINDAGGFKEKELDKIALSEDGGLMAISTLSGNITLLDVNNGFEISRTISRDSLYGNAIGYLGVYKGNILVGTEDGLNIISEENQRLFDSELGISITDFTEGEIHDDTLYLGTSKGYYEIDLFRLMNLDIGQKELRITKLEVENEMLEDGRDWFGYPSKTIELDYNRGNLTVEYELIGHPFPKKLNYSYRIRGMDETWSSYVPTPQINLPYLPIGDHVLEARIKDLSTGKVATFPLMEIAVNPPFWLSWWFITICLLFLIGALYLLYKERMESVRRMEQQKALIQKRLVETKLEALQSQMNPHFTFNAMNSIQNYIIDNDVDNALMYLGEFAKLIRQTLENSSRPFISLAEEISYLKSYMALENMRFGNRVKTTITYNGIDLHDTELPPMIIQPFVENAFVHAFPKGHSSPELTVSFVLEEGRLICTVKDNGVGMGQSEQQKLHESKGIKLVEERIRLINQKEGGLISIESKEQVGVEVKLIFEKTHV